MQMELMHLSMLHVFQPLSLHLPVDLLFNNMNNDTIFCSTFLQLLFTFPHRIVENASPPTNSKVSLLLCVSLGQWEELEITTAAA